MENIILFSNFPEAMYNNEPRSYYTVWLIMDKHIIVVYQLL